MDLGFLRGSPPLTVSIVSGAIVVPTATLFAPAAVVIALFHPLVGPMARLVAVGSAFTPVAGPDPSGSPSAGLFPAARGPGPAVVLAIPVARDPDMVPTGPVHSDFMANRRWRIRSHADVDGRELHANPDLGGSRCAGEGSDHYEGCG